MTHDTSLPPAAGDRKARKNALLLGACQALAGSNQVVNLTLGGIMGALLAEDKTLSTLPISTMLIGTVVTTVPASLYMRHVGRRLGFMTGAVFGMAGAGVVASALWLESFALACLGTFLFGVYNAFVQYFRFAAADTASPAFRPKAISWVLAGGVAAAFFGPQIVIWGKDLLAPVPFAGAYAVLIVVGAVSFCILNFVDVPKPADEVHDQPARPLRRILSQPRIILAIACAMVSYAMMNRVMTATPLAMIGAHHAIDDAAFVIQWHVVAMFAPSFFTGNLIARFGAENMIMAGLALMLGCGVAALTGTDVVYFQAALVLLGLGWNFSFIAATSMLAGCYRSSERNKVQAANDFCVFGTVVLASGLSGAIFQLLGWPVVLMVLMAITGGALVLVTVWRLGLRGEPVS